MGVNHLLDKFTIIKKVIGSLLNDIDTREAAICHDKICSIHKQDICAYHDAIIMIMIIVCSETIPISKSGCSNVKAVSGWYEYIERYFRTSSGTVFGLTMVNLGMV